MDYINEFEKRMLPVDCQYIDREDRNRFAAEWISKDILLRKSPYLPFQAIQLFYFLSPLTDFHPRVFFVDYVDSTFSSYHSIISVSSFNRF